MLFTYLRELKELAGNPSNAEIAERSGVQESTISRMMSGNVDNPRLQTAVDVVVALNGSLDELVGIVRKQPDSVVIDDPIEVMEKVIKVEEAAARPLDDAERQRYKDRIQYITDEALSREEQIREEARRHEAELRKEYTEREASLKAEFSERTRHAHRRETVLFAVICALVVFIMGVLLIDLMNPTMGYFRYANANVGEVQNMVG